MAREGFHDVLFPLAVTLGARGGPERRTDITQLASGAEVRRGRWSNSRRSWDVSGGVAGFGDAEDVLAFFEEREGRRYSFRFRDPFDHRSSRGSADPTATDQTLGTGDGSQTIFSLKKQYGAQERAIELAVQDSVLVAVNGVEAQLADWTLTPERNGVVFAAPPAPGAVVTAGFVFDVPVRFGQDRLQLELGARGASVPAITLIEVRP